MSERIKYVSINSGSNGIRLNYTRCYNEESKSMTDNYEYRDEEMYFTGTPSEVSQKLSEALMKLVPGMMKEAGIKEELKEIEIENPVMS